MSLSTAKPGAGAVYRRLLGYAAPHSRMFALGVLGMIISAATDVALARFIGFFFDDAFVSPKPRVLWAVPLGILVIFLFRGIGDYMSTYFPGWVGRQIIKALRAQLFAQYLHLPTRYYDRTSSATMLSRLTYDVEQVAEAATNSITVLIRDTLTILGLLGYMVYLNWRLTALALLVAPLIAWIMQGINRRFRRYSKRIQASMGDVTRVSKEAIEGHRLIKVFTAEEHEQRAFEAVNEHNRHSHVRLINARAASNPVVQMIAACGLAAVLYLAISEVLRQEMVVSEFTAFITAMMLIPAPLRRLINVGGPLQQGIAAGGTVFEVLDETREAAGGTRPLGRARGEVEYRGVTFGYGSRGSTAAGEPVLRDVQLHVPAGHTVAVVGRSGSGKSTLVGLVPRFYEPDAGSVLVDGADVREYPLRDLRRQIAFVGQDVVLFDDTIRANIAFGEPSVDEAAVQAAAAAAHVLEFARSLPQGLDTIVGDRGALLSGGQKQRIAIARALLRNAPILILDEATSALDTESERHIQAALEELVRGRTTLVIAHRLSTIEQADLIVVMDRGRIVERGTHAELIAREGVYAQLHRLQFDA